MFEHTYSQPNAPDPVLDSDLVLSLARRHVPAAQAVTGVEESGGEARVYGIDDGIILKVQRPQQLRPLTSLEREVFFLRELEREPAVNVPRILGYGREGAMIEYTVMSRMPGIAMRHVQLDADAYAKVLFALGATLRRIHELPQQPFQDSGLFPTDDSFAIVRSRFAYYFDAMARRIHDHNRPWSLPQSPEEIGALALAALPQSEERVALHSNPGPEHTFVLPGTGAYSGLIDFGDAFISHPALDLRRRAGPRDRDAILRGYTADGPADQGFMGTWRVVQVLSDLIDIAAYPDRTATAQEDLEAVLHAL